MIFAVLKAIGIILLVIFILILLLILVLLFSPIRLKVNGSFRDAPEGEAQVKWIFGLVRLGLVYKDKSADIDYSFPFNSLIFGKDDKENKPTQKRKTKPREPSPPQDDKQKAEKSEAPKQAPPKPPEPQPDQSERAQEAPKPSPKPARIKSEDTEDISITPEEIKTAEKNIEEEEESIFKRLLHTKNKKDTLLYLFQNLRFLLRKIKFKTLNIDLTFGFSDPSLTGKVLGTLYASGIVFIRGISIEGDFTKAVITGNTEIDGRTNLLYILIPIARILLNKNIRKLIF